MNVSFYRCSICGQIVGIVKNTDVPLVCCGQEMEKLIPCSVDASYEKHVPDVRIEGHKVMVAIGSAPHPMVQEHCIEWVCLETNCGVQRKELKPGAEARVCFRIGHGEQVKAVYAYCNLHGLWKATMQ